VVKEGTTTMPAQDQKIAAGLQRMQTIFGSRIEHLLWQLMHYATTGQTFDATFYDREPILEVTLDQAFAHEFIGGSQRDTRYLRQLCSRIGFSDGTIIPITSIWTLNYMPHGGIDNETLSNIDLAEAAIRAGQNGETVREMIRDTYRCASAAEEDYFVRRWIAS
jgi:hypothetical protein